GQTPPTLCNRGVVPSTMRSPIASHFRSDAIPSLQRHWFASSVLDVQTFLRSNVLTIPISPLVSVLTKIPSVTSLESALTQKCRGVASRMVLRDRLANSIRGFQGDLTVIQSWHQLESCAHAERPMGAERPHLL